MTLQALLELPRESYEKDLLFAGMSLPGPSLLFGMKTACVCCALATLLFVCLNVLRLLPFVVCPEQRRLYRLSLPAA